MELKVINRAISIAMGEDLVSKPVNYMDDGPNEARFIEWADEVIKEVGLSETLAELEIVPLGEHQAARWRFSVLRLWELLPPTPS